MQKEPTLQDFVLHGAAYYLPSVSIDNVIFGFYENELKVLLLQAKDIGQWVLPGGFIYKEEAIDDAAARILKTRTGLKSLFLQQFQVFGRTKSGYKNIMKDLFQREGISILKENWLLQRFITIGYYALVDYNKVKPQPDVFSNPCAWHHLEQLPELLFDHRQIIEKALQALRLQLNHQPIGYNLLPEAFPLKSLQVIYETILGRKLDRSNFNRKMLSYGILQKREKQFSGGAHKAPFLYAFDKEAYFKALEHGLEKDF